MATLTLQPTGGAGIDAYISSRYPTTNYGTQSTIYIGEYNAQVDTTRVLIKFDLSSLPDEAVITDAVLSLYCTADNSSNARTFSVYRLKKAFTEASATWNSRSGGVAWTWPGGFDPADCEQTPIGSRVFSAAESLNGWKLFPLTATAKSDLDLGYGWLIKADTEANDQYGFNSSDAGSNTPKLVIQYTIATDLTANGTMVSGGTGALRVEGPTYYYLAASGDSVMDAVADIYIAATPSLAATGASTMDGTAAMSIEAAPVCVVAVRMTMLGLLVDGSPTIAPQQQPQNCWEVHLYERNDVYVARLDNAFHVKYLEELNGPGSGSLQMYANDYKVRRIADDPRDVFRYGRVVRLRYKGADVGAWVIEHYNEKLVAATEGAGRIISVDGRGLLGRFLSEAKVYPAYMIEHPITGSLRERRFGLGGATWEQYRLPMSKAAVFLVLWKEWSYGDPYGRSRGGGNLTTNFTDTHDSYGQAWIDLVGIQFAGGQETMLDVMRRLSGLGIDFRALPDRKLNAYQTLGQDLSNTVQFRKGWNILEAERDGNGKDLATVVLGYTPIRFSESITTDSDALDKYGRVEASLSVEFAGDDISKIDSVVALYLAQTAEPPDSIRLKVVTNKLFPFYDYNVGDTVHVHIPGDDGDVTFEGDYRVYSIALYERSGPCDCVAELTLNSREADYLIRLQKALRSSLTVVTTDLAADMGLTYIGPKSQ